MIHLRNVGECGHFGSDLIRAGKCGASQVNRFEEVHTRGIFRNSRHGSRAGFGERGRLSRIFPDLSRHAGDGLTGHFGDWLRQIEAGAGLGRHEFFGQIGARRLRDDLGGGGRVGSDFQVGDFRQGFVAPRLRRHVGEHFRHRLGQTNTGPGLGHDDIFDEIGYSAASNRQGDGHRAEWTRRGWFNRQRLGFQGRQIHAGKRRDGGSHR